MRPMLLDFCKPYTRVFFEGDGGTGGGGPVPAGTPTAAPAPTPAPATFQPITSQEQLDRVLGERLGRERAKFADYDEIKGKAAKFDELDAASKTELQKLADAKAASDTELERTKAELKNQKLETAVLAVAGSKNIIDPTAVVALLDRSKIDYGDDGVPKNLDALIDELIKAKPYLVGKNGRGPAPLPGSGAPTPSTGTSMDDWMRQRAKR